MVGNNSFTNMQLHFIQQFISCLIIGLFLDDWREKLKVRNIPNIVCIYIIYILFDNTII